MPVISEVSRLFEDPEFARWSRLAGIKESSRRNIPVASIISDIKTNKISSIEELERVISTVGENKQSVIEEKDKIIAAFKEKHPDQEEQKIQKMFEELSSLPASNDNAVAQARKNFASLIDQIQGKVTDVTPEEVAAILFALDEISAFKIAE